jgi:hypothetical protein
MHLQSKHDTPLPELCALYGLSPITILSWRYMKGFPSEAISKTSPGTPAMFDRRAIDNWLRNRPVHRRQRPARWWSVVDHPGFTSRRSTGSATNAR